MNIRPTKSSDIIKIDEIWRQHHAQNFGLPNLDNVVTHAVVEDETIIAFGYVKLFAEAILVLDLGATQRNKVTALQLLMSEAIRGSQRYNIKQLHAFIQDKHFAKVMMKHFSFTKCKGEALCLEL